MQYKRLLESQTILVFIAWTHDGVNQEENKIEGGETQGLGMQRWYRGEASS